MQNEKNARENCTARATRPPATATAQHDDICNCIEEEVHYKATQLFSYAVLD